MQSLFENFKPRASQIGHLMTNLPKKFTDEDQVKLDLLLEVKLTGKNPSTGRANKWDVDKQKEVNKLKESKKGIDKLPSGAITKLEEIFNHVFWGRRKLIFNKYLEKGNMNEEDSLDLYSQVDGISYWKNDEFFDNGLVCGTPDNITEELLRDIKSNYEFDTFKKAEMTELYSWQIKSYLWLTGKRNGACVKIPNNTK